MFEYIINGCACVGAVSILLLAAYGAVALFRPSLIPSQPEPATRKSESIVVTHEGRSYRLRDKVGDRVMAVRVDGVGFMLLNEASVKPEYVQVIRQFLAT